MARELTALEDLDKAFRNFRPMSALVDGMVLKVDEIDNFNKNSAGNDDIGKEYHKNADKPTAVLISLIKRVRKTLDSAGMTGEQAAALFSNADDDASSVV
ncbi:hypothetical protein OH807_35840 [Kitasatospora sp. NBC_01560]|uniref:hypothetical protein n=1 Tax=Kitasatospora sp. NBC_01560 TaxID=2975965 RepID=UPI0038701BD9